MKLEKSVDSNFVPSDPCSYNTLFKSRILSKSTLIGVVGNRVVNNSCTNCILHCCWISQTDCQLNLIGASCSIPMPLSLTNEYNLKIYDSEILISGMKLAKRLNNGKGECIICHC